MVQPFPASINEFINMDLLADANAATPSITMMGPAQPVAVHGEDETAGMSFAEMFR